MPNLVLFDFDGTLADTAPGLATAANMQRLARGLPPLPYAQLRPLASHGARGLLGAALGLSPDDVEYPNVRDRFLQDYAEAMYAHSSLFPGVAELLSEIEEHGMRWGIVTNKLAWLAEPLIVHLELNPATIVCGDTTAHAKPHPEPLLHAARQVGFEPERCIYVGDDLRDIQAGKAAGMPTVAAAWGYCGNNDPVSNWQATRIAESPEQVWAAIRSVTGSTV